MDIPLKKDLAKRLGKLLFLYIIHSLMSEPGAVGHSSEHTWDLCPHFPALNCKQIILNNIQELNGGAGDNKSQVHQKSEGWGSDLGLFLSGLYNFYQFAAFEVKKTFLDIVRDFILNIDKELLLSLPGFMICMLPALEDQNAELLKMVEEILKKAETIVGTSEFYGEIWKTMLRTNRTRLSAIKYLEKRIPKDLDAARDLKRKD